MRPSISQVITVTLNPAVDQTVTIPGFKTGAVNRVEQVRSSPGGKGVNVASALADYGHRVAATGFLGRENAAIFEALLRKKDIADHFVRLDGQTRIGIKISDPSVGETTDINFPGITPSARDLDTLRARLRELVAAEPAWIVIAGSVPPGVDPGVYREFTELIRESGNKVVLDASGPSLGLALEAGPHIIKPNIHELEELVGRELKSRDALTDAAGDLMARGIELVAISMGAEGALFVTAEESVMAMPPNVTVLSTVGAGDAMVAGIIAGQLRDLSLANTARLATAFSLDALARGESGVTSHAVIEAYMQQIEIL